MQQPLGLKFKQKENMNFPISSTWGATGWASARMDTLGLQRILRQPGGAAGGHREAHFSQPRDPLHLGSCEGWTRTDGPTVHTTLSC